MKWFVIPIVAAAGQAAVWAALDWVYRRIGGGADEYSVNIDTVTAALAGAALASWLLYTYP